MNFIIKVDRAVDDSLYLNDTACNRWQVFGCMECRVQCCCLTVVIVGTLCGWCFVFAVWSVVGLWLCCVWLYGGGGGGYVAVWSELLYMAGVCWLCGVWVAVHGLSCGLTVWRVSCCMAGIAQWLERRTRDWKVAGSNPCWNGGRIFFSRVDFLCWLLFRYPFHPRVTAVARKRSRSFCQKCRWQVTAKHAYTLRMWLCMKWHGAWLYGVHRTCAETAAVSCGTNHASVVSTPLRWIFHTHTKKAL